MTTMPTPKWKIKLKPVEVPPRLLRSLPLARQCTHNTGENGTTKAGCGQCTTYHCSIKGTVKLAECANCGEWHGVEQLVSPPQLQVNGDWIKAPDVWPMFRKMIEQEKANYKPGTYEGDGIVIVGGGKYFPAAYCNARLIRHHGCNLPIQLWYLGRNNEMPDKWQRIMEQYGATCHDADAQTLITPMRILNGWELKFYAIQQSSFRRIIYLDADCYPMRDPTFTLNDPRFLGSGAVFQRDCKAYEFIKPEVLEMFGLPKEKVWDLESGACLIDKNRWGLALHLTVFLNSYSDLVYKVVYGDKTTPALAARLAGQSYATPIHAPGGGNWGLMQKWFEGLDMWQHRIHCKPTLEPTNFTSNQHRKVKNIAWTNEISAYLNELRRLI